MLSTTCESTGQKFTKVRIADKVRQVEGWLTDNECALLYFAAQTCGDNANLVEIGAWKGKSTICLAAGLRNDGSKVYTIDPFDASGDEDSQKEYEHLKGDTPLLDQFMRNLSQYSLANRVVIVQGHSSNTVNHVPAAIDVLFIDGNHSIEACRQDFELYTPRLKSGGKLLIHDYDASRPTLGPTWVVENLVWNSFTYNCLTDSLWVGRKR